MPKTIYFITGNPRKVEDYNRRLEKANFELKHLEYDFNEGRSLDIAEITKSKISQAKKAFPNKKLLVEDRGFAVTTLNKFPGPFVKMFLESIGVEGLLKLMEDKLNREAKFITVLGYFDGQKEHYFVDEEIGFITKQKQGQNLRGWTEILYVYGHSLFPDKSLAQLNDLEWQEYLKEVEKNDFLNQFIEFLAQTLFV